MDIENIATLSEQLQSLGFGASIGHRLMQQICFMPESFTLHQHIEYGKDVIHFYLFFKRSAKYICEYYDAVLRKEIQIPEATINNIDAGELDQRMQQMDWIKIFDTGSDARVNFNDASIFADSKKVEGIVSDLRVLESSAAKEVSHLLKIRHWADTPAEQFIPHIASFKNRLEISQRFYLMDGAGISAGEAYRFLNNRWMEKQMQKKKNGEQTPGESSVSNASKNKIKNKKK